ncbi:MAG: hypothetical protein HOB73_06550 [Planctomycetaceae bacterium]|jgi:hypothetical protein|nr:hypothetical protein [Planctomycetaceae bacterium]
MYRERYTPWFTWLLAVVILCTVVGMLPFISGFLSATDSGGADFLDDERVGYIIGISVTGFVTVFVGFLAVVFSRYFIEVDRGTIRFGYLWWNVSTTVEQVESVEVDEAKFKEFLGMGWRISVTTKRIGYVVSFGEAVEIKIRNGKTYLISCRDPEACVKAIKS